MDNETDPMKEVFQMDQTEAQSQEQTRDQESWTLNIRNGAAQAAIHEAMAAKEMAVASFWQALAQTVHIIVVTGLAVLVIWGLTLLVGLFR